MDGQRLAVLATEQDGRPYASLVAFAFSPDLTQLFFITPRPTQKYRNLSGNPRVAVMIDSRANTPKDFESATAVTAIGQGCELTENAQRQKALNLYLAKHPGLKTFAQAPSTSLFAVHVEKYIWVDHFQHVTEVVPA